MNTIRSGMALACVGLVGGAAAIAACTVSITSNPLPDASTEDSSTGDSAVGDGAVADGSDAADAAPPMASVRVAHLSPDAPALDFCVAPHGTTTFTGPLLAALVTASDGGIPTTDFEGGVPGITYAQVTAYMPLAPAQYDVRIVAAGATSCATGLVADQTNLLTLAASSSYTFAAMGDMSPAGSDPALSIKALTDDTMALSGVSMRFVHASPSLPALDMGTGSLALVDFQPLFTNVTFGTAGSQSDAGVVDTNGYVPMTPATSQTFSAHTSTGATSDAVAASLTTVAGSVITTFAVGAKTGDSAHPVQFLACGDNSPPVGPLSDCSLGP